MSSRCAVTLFHWHVAPASFLFFFFNDTATTEIYTLSLHDALPICGSWIGCVRSCPEAIGSRRCWRRLYVSDRKSTRLNSSHDQISYAVFCLKKKKTYITTIAQRIDLPELRGYTCA